MIANAESISRPMSISNLHVAELKTIAESQPELIERWRGLVEVSPEAPIELHPELVLKSAPPGSRGLLVHAAGDPTSLAQLAVLQEKLVRLPWLRGVPWRLPLRGLRLVGNRVLGAQDEATAREVVGRFESLLDGPAGGHDCILFEDLDIDSPLCRAAEQASHTRVVWLAQPQTRWALRFPEDASTYWTQFSSKTRYNFRRMQRLLEHEWTAIREPSQVADFLTDSARISQNSWQSKRIGVRVRTDEKEQQHFAHLAQLGALRCYMLRNQNAPIAFAIGTQWNGRFMLEEIGYDAAYAKSSPGTVLLLRMLEDMLACDTPQWLDFGFGDGDYKRLFGNHETRSGTLLLVSRRMWPTLATWLSRAGATAEQGIRRCLKVGGLAGRLRQLYRR